MVKLDWMIGELRSDGFDPYPAQIENILCGDYHPSALADIVLDLDDEWRNRGGFVHLPRPD